MLEGRLRRYFERMEAIVERHGGTVEKFIGDAVMAVFGVPVAHEDDALRALPGGGGDARRACRSSSSQARIGVNTGEIVTSKRGTLVDRRRRERGRAAGAGGRAGRGARSAAPTRALVGAAARSEEVEPLDAEREGRAGGGVPPARGRRGAARALDRPFVGRGREVALLREAWERADAEQARASSSRWSARPASASRVWSRRRSPGSSARVVRGALPPVRRGDHLLARRRGGQAARHAALRRDGGGRGAVTARRERPADERGRDRVGVSQAARGAGAARRLLRRPAVGRGDVPRSRRVDGAALGRGADAAAVHGSARSCSSGAPPGRCRSGWSRCHPTTRTR